jgi:hypothetical protein
MVPTFMKEGEVMNPEESGGMNMLIEKRGKRGSIGLFRKFADFLMGLQESIFDTSFFNISHQDMLNRNQSVFLSAIHVFVSISSQFKKAGVST